MLSDIDVNKITDVESLKKLVNDLKAKKELRSIYYEYIEAKSKVFLITSLEKPVISIRTDH